MKNLVSKTLPEPGQQVAVFLDDAASGATLGYYGEYLGVPFSSISRGTHREDEYLLRVFIPFLGRGVDVPQGNVLPCAQSKPDNSGCPPTAHSGSECAPFGSIRFLRPVESDNEEMKGFFCIGDRPWNHFYFQKTSRPHISYEFSAPVNGHSVAEGILYYEVPRHLRLDRAFLLQALTEIMGVEIAWSAIATEAAE